MRKNSPVQSVGALNTVALENGVLVVQGWAASADAGVLETVKVSAAGRTFDSCQIAKHLPRPDVKRSYPELDRAESSGFQVRVPLTPEEQRYVRLVALTPVFERGEGQVVVHIINPALPLPGQEDVDCIGGGDYVPISLEFCGHFIQLAGLRPTEAVLEIGCGVGRMAYSLAHYLTPPARYDGFDVVERLIRWCHQVITPRFPNFVFHHADLYNKMYNPAGKMAPEDFLFPYESEKFDFVFLTSVFTHMLAKDMRHYLDEIYRVLKPGGRCLATFFLLNEESKRLVRDGKSARNLVHPLGDSFVADPDSPEECIGFEEALVQQWIAERRFRLAATYRGSWCGRSLLASTSFQDMLVICK
jgi:SAM-dependent methyltransferase